MPLFLITPHPVQGILALVVAVATGGGSSTDAPGLVTAIATAAAALVAALAAYIAAKAAREAGNTVSLMKEQLRAQSFGYLLSYEREIHLPEAMKSVRKVADVNSVLTPAEKGHIISVVNFLNDVAHFVRHGYVPAHVIWLLYTPAIEACQVHLLDTNWLDCYRDELGNQKYYLHFRTLCQRETMTLLYQGRLKDVPWPNRDIKPSHVLVE